MKKAKSIISILAALSVMTAVNFPASAEGGTYTGSVHLSKYAVSAEEVAAGNVCITATAYLRGYSGDNLTITSAKIGFGTDSELYMRNLIDPNKTYTESSYSCLGDSFITAYKPFCFCKVSGGVYSPNAFICTTRDYCMDPIAGTYIVYSGNDTVTVKLPGRYFIDENGERPNDNKTHEIVCPLTVNSDGSATYTFTYADIYTDHYDVATITPTIEYYQPELLNVGDYIPDINNKYSWAAAPSSESSFLGNSDDFPLIQADVFFKKGTPCGIYNIYLDEDFCDVSATLDGTSMHLPMVYQGAAIAVGVEKAEVKARSALPLYSCYFVDDTNIITGASVGCDYICDVTYSDGTSESVNVTGAVNAGVSPKEVMDNTDGEYFIGDMPMYCGDTPITLGDEKNKVKILIGVKGDANLDGKADISDATAILQYYASDMAGNEPELPVEKTLFNKALSFFLSDIDTESQSMDSYGTLDINDSSSILDYYANIVACNNISWDQFIQ